MLAAWLGGTYFFFSQPPGKIFLAEKVAPILVSYGRAENAMSLYRNAHAINPDNQKITAQAALLAFQLKLDDEATNLFQSLMPVTEYHALAVRHLAQIAVQKHDFENALKFSDEWIKADQKDALAWQTRGSANAGLFRTADAARDFDRSTELDPHSRAAELKKRLHSNLSSTFPDKFFDPTMENKRGDYESTIRDCIRLLHAMDEEEALMKLGEAEELKPRNPEPHFFRALIHHRNHAFRDEIKELQQAYKGLPKSLTVPLDIPKELGRSRIDLLGHQRSITGSDIYFRIGRCYRALGDNKKALDYYNEAAAMAPDDSRLYHAKADVYKRLGDYTRAKEQKELAKKNRKSKDPLNDDLLIDIIKSQDDDSPKRNAATKTQKD